MNTIHPPVLASLIRLTHDRTGLTPTVALPYTLIKRSRMQVGFSPPANHCCFNSTSISAIIESTVVLSSAEKKSCD
jgi:hypothetical protein